MTRVVEAWLDAEGSGRDLLEALANRYDRWSVPILDGIEARLDAAADRLRAEPKHGGALEEIVRGLVEWDEYSQPCQLLLGQKLVDEPRSKGLAQKLRGLAVWLGNQRQEYRRALVITKALLTTSPNCRASTPRSRRMSKPWRGWCGSRRRCSCSPSSAARSKRRETARL